MITRKVVWMLLFVAIMSISTAVGQTDSSKKKNDNLSVLKKIFDQYGMKGSFLIANQALTEYRYYNKKRAESAFLPASTFKIPNTIIGLETGAINSETVFLWDSTERRLDAWEKDLKLKESFQVSCVPCYQEVARKIGFRRMKDYLGKFDYGTMIFDENTVDKFWLEGESKISSYEQIDFLKKFYNDELGIKQSTKAIMLNIMLSENTKDYKLYGKTGWSVRNGNNYGWYVGFLETPGNLYFFAVTMEPKNKKDTDSFAKNRKQLTIDCLKKVGLIK